MVRPSGDLYGHFVFFFPRNYSRTSANGHVPLRHKGHFILADSPYIYSYLNLPTTATATNACPQLPK